MDEDGVEEKAFGHPVRTADGFQGAAKLLCLAWPALEDLLQRNDLRAFNPERTGLYLCLPNQGSRHVHGEESLEASKRSPGPGLCARLMKHTGLALPRSQWNHVDEGHAGVIRAISEASVRLRSGQWHRCLIGGVDSLLDPRSLEWLRQAGRLKTPTKPDGLQPGEAGAFVLIERFDAARQRNADVLAVVAGASLAAEAGDEQRGTSSNGAAFAEAVTRVLAAEGASVRADAWLISDHNGEHRRANELGSGLARISQGIPWLGGKSRWFPAASFGDTGAASCAVAICMAVRSFERRYAGGAAAIVVASSDGCECGALLIDGPGVESKTIGV
jgi:3-oxoacyl-[acyl-carrier-protein] synthase-1